MPITSAAISVPHISVPIRLPDGQPYGMFCCIGLEANPSLNARDLQNRAGIRGTCGVRDKPQP